VSAYETASFLTVRPSTEFKQPIDPSQWTSAKANVKPYISGSLTKRGMEARDILFSAVMIASVFVLTYRLLSKYHDKDAVVILSAMILIAMLALMLLSISTQLRKMEEAMSAKERSLRTSIRSVEESVERRMDAVIERVNRAVERIEKEGRFYR